MALSTGESNARFCLFQIIVLSYAVWVNIIHGMNDILPRHAEAAIRQSLKVFPVVVITGTRQSGKSTLATNCTSSETWRAVSLDDLFELERAKQDPQAFVAGSVPMLIDEVQRVPNLMIAIKREVDMDRRRGRYILTGSAHLLLHSKISESLAGRAGYLTLWPMTRRELKGLGRPGLWQELWGSPDEQWREVIASHPAMPEDWKELAQRGGMPEPALQLTDAAERIAWQDAYLATYLERDLRDLSVIESLGDFRRLMRAAALRLGGLQNQAEIARDLGMSQTTVQRYLTLLEVSYQVCRVQAYTRNRTSRLMKSPKLYWSDTALALRIAGETEPRGAHLENIVFHDLSVWAATQAPRPEIMHWRTTSRNEVDFVIESRGRLLPIEVNAATRVGTRDIAGLKAFRAEYGPECRAGLLLYGGAETFWVAPDILAAPWWAVV